MNIIDLNIFFFFQFSNLICFAVILFVLFKVNERLDKLEDKTK
jgi:hypothetical protein